MAEQQEKNVGKFIKDYWVILAFIISVIITWTNFLAADASAKLRLDKVEDTISILQNNNTEIITKLSRIETDISWIKLNLK